MPGGRKRPQTPAALQDLNHLLWAQTGRVAVYKVNDWDPDAAAFLDACLQIVASGATVVIRPMGGGTGMGIAIWEGDVRHAPAWLREDADLDAWSQGIRAAVLGRNIEGEDTGGAPPE